MDIVNIAFGFDIFFPETNGVITSTVNLAKNLVELGHSVYFFVPKNKQYDSETLEGLIEIVHVPSVPSGIYPGIRLANIHSTFVYEQFKKYSIDIVHETAPWLVCLSLSKAARRLRIPVIVTHHTLIDDPTYIRYGLKSKRLALVGQRIIWKVLLNPCYRSAIAITAPSKTTCQDLAVHIKPPRDIQFISNGIDISRFLIEFPIFPFPQSIPQKYFEGSSTFVFVGRIGYEKSIDTLLFAFAELKKMKPDAKLLMIGSGPADSDMRRLSTQLCLNDAVCFAGTIPNQELIGSHLLQSMVAFVTASLTENQPMTIIEALCSGCPVIVPDDPHMTAIVDEQDGWIFKSADVQDLTRTMEYVLDHPQERSDKAIEARKQIERFDGKRIAGQFESLYSTYVTVKQ